MIHQHQQLTGSTVAAGILSDWQANVEQFQRVIPSDYKRVLAEMEEEKHMASASTDGDVVDLAGWRGGAGRIGDVRLATFSSREKI